MSSISKHRQQERENGAIYKADESSKKPKFYVLDMFPYPSGAGLHVGHPKGYVATDVLARQKMLQGYNVLHPMGWDAFGLPAEQYAIKNKVNPTVSTAENIAGFKKQLQNMGFTYDREREVNTTDPEFYKRTQRTFIKLYEHYYDQKDKKAKPINELPIPDGLSDEAKKEYIDNHRLAYVDYKPILRSVDLQTAIAQEDLDENGNCERTGGPVERRPMRQRVIRITDYAERLLDGLDELVERPDSVKQMQRHWIGKAQGTEFTMKMADHEDTIGIYTTRIDTVYGMSYVALAPEHPLLSKITTPEHAKEVEKYVKIAKSKGELQRTDLNKDKTGVFTGAYAINPFNNQQVPIRVADYVLGGYGTGAVMAVPAHDERDFAFAKKYDLPIIQTIAKQLIGEGEKTPQKNKETIERNVIDVIIENKEGKYLVLTRQDNVLFVGGGIEEGETEIQAIKKEITEETGYTEFEIISSIPCSYSSYYGYRKKYDVNHKACGQFFYVKLLSEKQIKSEIEEGHHTIQRVNKDQVENTILYKGHQIARNIFLNGAQAQTEKGVLVESGVYTQMTSDEAILAMQSRLTQQGIGGQKVQYKLQDRVFSRQRYRGEPIPMIHSSEKAVEVYTDTAATIHFADPSSFLDLVSTRKTFITRALNPDDKDNLYANTKNNDYILCIDNKTKKECVVQIKNSKTYGSIGELFKDKVVLKGEFLETFKTLEELEDHYENNRPGYIEELNNNGVIVWEVKLMTNIVAINESELPLKLPEVEHYEPTGTEEGPLANITDWIDTPEGKRESNTMPQRAGSSRYWLRYMDPKNPKNLVDPAKEKYRGQVDVYVGGMEHATRHLIYARFWHKFLYDIGVVSTSEPFKKLYGVGLVLAEDGRKMSKRRGNVVNPDDVIAQYGADAFRTYEMFMGPFENEVAWSTAGVKGVKKFLDKINKLTNKIDVEYTDTKDTLNLLHKTIRKVSEDIENFKFNTAISQLMICVNTLTDQTNISKDTLQTLTILISPFAPHLAEEIRCNILGNDFSIFTKATRPIYDENLLTEDTIKIAVQFNGKVRGTIQITPEATQDEVMNIIQDDEQLAARIESAPKKIIYIAGKIINIII